MELEFRPNRQAVRQLAGEQAMRRVLEQVAKDGARAAADKAPRASGRLAASVTSTVEKDGGQWVGVVSFGEWYGKLWEWGHRGRSKPFLRPGVQESLSRYGGRFKSQ